MSMVRIACLPHVTCCLLAALAWTAPLFAGEKPVEFASKPTVKREGAMWTIHFALSSSADVEVAIVDKSGKVVRHLAAGLLGGKNPPPSPLAPGLVQSIPWDGADDYGDPVTNSGDCSARVRTGMGVRLDRIVGGDPYAYYSKLMGQGDHAAWRITGLEAKSDGKVYVLGNACNYGPPALRQYAADGEYLRTVYPPPAGKPVEQMTGWGIHEMADGRYAFQYSDLSSPALSNTLIAGTRGRIATLIPSPEPDQLLLANDFDLMRVHTDGTAPAQAELAEPLIAKPATEASEGGRGNWQLVGHTHLALSSTGKECYLGGIFAGALDERRRRIGAAATGFWRDGQVYRIDLTTRQASPFFALEADKVITDMDRRASSPIADARYGNYAALQGVACDADGNVFVCDRQNERIVVLDSAGKILRQIPISHPDAIAVSPVSKALFVTTRTGHYHGKGELKLAKYSDWTKETIPTTVLPLCEVHHFSQRTHLAAAEAGGKVFVWVAYTALPVRVYQETSTGLELVKDFYEAGTQRALDMQHMAVDPHTETLFLPDGFNRCFKIADWERPDFELCMQDETTPLPALSVAIDARHRRLFVHADRKPITRYLLEGKYHPPAPFAGTDGGNACTPNLTNDWRIGLGHSDRGIAVAPDGSVVGMNNLGTGANYSGNLRYFQANAAKTPWEGLLFTSFGENVRAAGARFDPRGNLYAGKLDGPAENLPVGLEKDSDFQQTTGRIYKFAPTGSQKQGSLFPTAPTAPAKVYDIHYGAIGPRFSRTPRFGVDGYGRIYYPTSLISRVSVIDNEGNPLVAFGEYGNRDSLGGLADDRVPTDDIPMAWPSSVDATDDYIYVSDIVNIRVLRIAKTFAASETVHLP